MSIITTFPYTTPSNYTYDTDKIEVAGGVAKLKLVDNASQTFTEDFADDTDFTYDSDKTEFSGGQVQQKSQVAADSTFGASYDSDINGSYGNGTLTGSGVGSPVITGNRLDLTGNTLKYVDYDADLNADSQQTGCIRFKLTPNYSGAPSGVKGFVSISKQVGFNDNGINIFQSSTLIFIQIKNSAAGSIVSNAESWSPVSGTTYEIELNYDITTGATRLFIDGIQKGPTQTGTGTRDSNIGLLRVGSDISATQNSDFYIEDLIIFDAVQHTSNYTPGYTVPENLYVSDIITLPQFSYSGVGSIQAFTNISSTESNAPRYIVNGEYWNGSAWAASSNTWETASPLSDVLANIATLTPADTMTIKIVTNDGTSQMSVSNLVLTYTGQIYPTDDPTIEAIATFNNDGLIGFTETSTITGSDNIKHILAKGSDYYYWNGSAWAVSDGTYSQSNTASEILTNIASFTTTAVSTKIKSFLHSDDGTTKPELDLLTIEYDFTGESASEISKCIVYGYVNDIQGESTGDTVRVELNKDMVLYKDDQYIKNKTYTATIGDDGYWEIELVENENMEDFSRYIFNFGNGIEIIKYVPDEVSKKFVDLTG